MQPNPQFRQQSKLFWANVRTISQTLGYASGGKVRTYTLDDLRLAMHKVGLGDYHLANTQNQSTALASDLIAYFDYRADVLNEYVEPLLMDAPRARAAFETLSKALSPKRPFPMNKQRGEKKQVAYLTAMVNMIIEANIGDVPCDYDPRILTTVTRDNQPLRTLSRRMDGCFPSCVNPLAVWEIKEYYYTTTFGSRIADGVYETLLDGLELEELREHEHIHIQHLLIVDSYDTWWGQGKSYLCRLVDMLNMGYLDEVLFGHEVIQRLPQIVRGWIEKLPNNN